MSMNFTLALTGGVCRFHSIFLVKIVTLLPSVLIEIEVDFDQIAHSDLRCVINDEFIVVQCVATRVLDAGVNTLPQRDNGTIRPET